MVKQQRSELTRQQLVRAAAELFDRVGYDRATMADISSAAGVTKGALYFHFPSKDMLATAVQAEAVEMLETQVARSTSVIELHQHIVRWMRKDTVVRACLKISHDSFCTSWLAATEWMLKGEVADHVKTATVLVGMCLGVETLRWNGIPREDPAEIWNLAFGQLPAGSNLLSLRGGTIDGST